ncbi:MAG: thioredoxin domain-containing protein [Deltaproteobacteria bacterium]|nr:thioredoxin domain-containing protein [Deltaproteobacteria bacterium]
MKNAFPILLACTVLAGIGAAVLSSGIGEQDHMTASKSVRAAAPAARTPGAIREQGNHLAGERSLYLKQHAHNPLDWYPWGEEALERARREDRPIFLSIGYSSCHWCHVMEEEVFEKDDVAEFMNEHFVSIKVDREERPDLDALYMKAVTALTGGGGWPMSVFLTPDLEPFHGGTYFPHDSFMSLARAVAEAYETKRSDLEDQGARLREHIMSSPALSQGPPVGPDVIDAAAAAALDGYDERWGGLASSMKFPNPVIWTFLLHHYRKTGDERIARAIRGTLDAMGSGGIHDHVAGGFHRYTVERTWLVPHFEKMLYDNAQLASLYTEAAVVFGDARYEEIARDTLDFMIREMSGDEGGFHASFDADSAAGEGAYYVWSVQEMHEVAGEDGPALASLLGVTGEGNFEGGSILTRRSGAEPEGLFDRHRTALREHRQKREPPALDRKIITSWNGLAISAMARGASAFGEERYIEAAVKAADFLWSVHRGADGGLLRASNQGHAEHEAVLDDYALFAAGLLDLYDASGDETHLARALELVRHVLEHFAHPEAGFYLTRDDVALGRQVRIEDTVRPSGNSVMLHVLLRGAALTGDGDLHGRVESMLGAYSTTMARSGLETAWWFDAAEKLAGPHYEVVVAGASDSLVDAFRKLHPSHALLVTIPAGGPDDRVLELMPPLAGKKALDGAPTAYVCRFGACKKPTSDPEVLRKQILEGWTY